MKALTICQPYAHLIAIGDKRVENRTWCTLYRGELAIHAGNSRKYLRPGDTAHYPGMAFGAIVAVAQLVACIPDCGVDRLAAADKSLAWLPDHPHVEGPWCWVLSDVRALDRPILCRGLMGLFSVSDIP